MSSIHQEVDITGSPEKIYNTLLSSQDFSRMTGGLPTKIDGQEGGSFSCFGGAIVGRNVELVSNRRIVQAWRVSDWALGTYSIAKFELTIRPDGGTHLVFDHKGFPEDQFDHLNSGWKTNYWDPLEKHLSQ